MAVIVYKDFEIKDGECDFLQFTEKKEEVLEFLKSIDTSERYLDTAEKVNGAY